MGSNIGSITRRLDALERALGDGGSDDHGPRMVVTFTRCWQSYGDGEARDPRGAWRERALFDQAIERVLEEARSVGWADPQWTLSVRATEDGSGAEVAGCPWWPETPGDKFQLALLFGSDECWRKYA
jgi:hypothetical protein